MIGAIGRVMLHEFVAVNREEIISRCRAKVAMRSVPPPTESEINLGSKRPGIGLTILPIEDDVVIEGDRQVLQAVVENLLQNAFKFTRPRSTVTLRVSASAERVLIEIQDECDGLPGENVDELFRAFEQRSADRTGLGLGLAFSRWGVEANNGGISARNRPDKGCVFTVDLPRVPVPPSRWFSLEAPCGESTAVS